MSFICVNDITENQNGQVGISASFVYYWATMQKTLPEIINEQIPLKTLAVILAVIALFAGYGIFTTINTGTIVVYSPAYNTEVFIDGHAVGASNEASSTLRFSETAGKHSVIVSKEGYFPWTEDVKITKHGTAELHPFIVPKNVPMENIPRSIISDGATGMNPEYEKIAPLFSALKTSEEIEPLVAATRIQGVTHADYFPGRTDVLLIATADGIYAVGIEKDDRPNFQPVYKGTNPLFLKSPEGTIYIKEGDSILRTKGFGK